MLEWYRPTHRYALYSGVFGIAWIVFVILFQGFITSGDFTWLARPAHPGWLVVAAALPLVLGGLLYWSFNREFVAAGAEWVAHQTGWVRVYDLTEVRIRGGYAKVYLCLTDAAGRKMDPSLTVLQHNRDLWDLVYNGILHSIRERDVVVDSLARTVLQLHGPLIVRDVLERQYRGDDEGDVAPKTRPNRGRRYRRGRRQP